MTGGQHKFSNGNVMTWDKTPASKTTCIEVKVNINKKRDNHDWYAGPPDNEEIKLYLASVDDAEKLDKDKMTLVSTKKGQDETDETKSITWTVKSFPATGHWVLFLYRGYRDKQKSSMRYTWNQESPFNITT